MSALKYAVFLVITVICLAGCNGQKGALNKSEQKTRKEVNAKEILGNPAYLAMSYGGYRTTSRDTQPSVEELIEDMRILSAMGIKVLRTYNVRLAHASNVLKAISILKKEDPNFEMYVMLGAWIDCKNAWTDQPLNHFEESENNASEIERAVSLAQEFPDIVKVIAVGNEAMVKWATSYFVQPDVILKWVNHLQGLKKEGKLPEDLWVTSSDNFASWGGGGSEYHVQDLEDLIKAVDFLSIHTYPMHDTHYNPVFWGIQRDESELSSLKRIDNAMKRAVNYAISQKDSVANYIKSLGIDKPIHIGETGWASSSNGFYGADGSKATDEYKQAIFYKGIRDWTKKEGMSCFYFEAFDEPWKDAQNKGGSENYFGLFSVDGKAKYALWDAVDDGIFSGLKRGKNSIRKSYEGNKEALLLEVQLPPERKSASANH